MSAESLNCPNCGAPLLGAAGQSTVVCDHCGSVIALQPPSPAPGSSGQPAAPREPSTDEPRYEYGPVPQQQPARSDLSSVALGPADAAHVLQLLHDHHELDAALYYQSKTGGSLDDANDAIRAIEAGLQDASAPLTPGAASTSIDPASLPDVLRLTQSGQTIAAIKAYREATGVGLREAKARVEQLERQQPPAAPSPIMPAVPMASPPVARRRGSGALGCSMGCLGVIALFMCIFGGCSAYVQSQSIYQCSLRAIKTSLAQKEIFTPPINGGYLVFVDHFDASAGSSWNMDANFYAPVWGSNGWGFVSAYISDNGRGRNEVSATLYTRGHSQELLPEGTINCAQ